MPVDRLHGALHDVIVCQIPFSSGASMLLSNVIVPPAFTVGTLFGHRHVATGVHEVLDRHDLGGLGTEGRSVRSE